MIDFDIFVLNATQQYFSYIMTTSFSGGRSRSTLREPPTMGKQLVNLINCGCEWSEPLFVIDKAGCKTHAVLVIGLYELLVIQLPSSLSTRALSWKRRINVDTNTFLSFFFPLCSRDIFFLLLYLYYTCEQFTSGCQETSKVYKYLQWTI